MSIITKWDNINGYTEEEIDDVADIEILESAISLPSEQEQKIAIIERLLAEIKGTNAGTK